MASSRQGQASSNQPLVLRGDSVCDVVADGQPKGNREGGICLGPDMVHGKFTL